MASIRCSRPLRKRGVIGRMAWPFPGPSQDRVIVCPAINLAGHVDRQRLLGLGIAPGHGRDARTPAPDSSALLDNALKIMRYSG